MDLTTFFRDQGIDVFSEVCLDNLSDEDRSSVVQFFPAAQSVIVFGKEVPVPVYRMPPKEKTKGMLRIAEALDKTAIQLAGRRYLDHCFTHLLLLRLDHAGADPSSAS